MDRGDDCADQPAIETVVRAHRALRDRTPLVQCLTNNVTVNLVANALLAAGASPAMVDNPEEAGDFPAVADAVLINLGTLAADTVKAMRLAAAGARREGRPWVLDPIGAGAMMWRHRLALELLEQRPTVIRGNASEIIGLSGREGGGRGVDSGRSPQDSLEAACELLDSAAAISASGPTDSLVGHEAQSGATMQIDVGGGSAWQPRVSGTGCALGAIVAAYCAVVDEPLYAATAAHVHVAVAAELAEQRVDGPGSFATAWLDALDRVDETTLRQRGLIAMRRLAS
ncbi:hydroxyethylthiazole kinase [Kushneria aurantia]|uniref:Hydroxyethylthiazole kinase n=1 Tax=Kushneria aurantia TaxID=504092 RepID=A0ABV6G0G9_9GAMM|nr:hydroxyethylthiazole kinase [Kushneria aurantia]